MEICVIMFYDENIKSYGDLNYCINKFYCKKYNLKIIVSNEKKTNRCSMWERLPMILDNISKYDYLIWIDADAFFYIDAGNISDIINNNTNVDFIFSKDYGNRNINTGFFIVKNSQYTIDFISRWLYDEELCNNNPYPYWPDQGVLIDMYDKNILEIQQKSIKLDYGILQHFKEYDKLDKTFVFHLAGTSFEERYETSKKYLAQLNYKYFF